MVDLTGDGPVSIELFVRRDLPRPSRRRADAIDADLRAFAAEGDVAAYRRQTWPKRIRVAKCDGEARDRYLTFSAWAEQAGVSLQPFFDTRERYDTDAGDYSACIVLPTMTVAVSVGGELSSVYPHADGDDTVTVEDCLDDLRDAVATTGDESVVAAD